MRMGRPATSTRRAKLLPKPITPALAVAEDGVSQGLDLADDRLLTVIDGPDRVQASARSHNDDSSFALRLHVVSSERHSIDDTI